MELEEQIAAKIREVDGNHRMGAAALSEVLMPLVRRAQAEAWEQGVKWAAVECGAIPDESVGFIDTGENPYRANAHYSEPNSRGARFVDRVEGRESECPECTEPASVADRENGSER